MARMASRECERERRERTAGSRVGRERQSEQAREAEGAAQLG